MRLFRSQQQIIPRSNPAGLLLAIFLHLVAGGSASGDLNAVGVTLVRQFNPALSGTAVLVAQVEPPESTNTPPAFEVSPSAVGQPVSLFSYSAQAGTSSTFPNSLGSVSGHASLVAVHFFGTTQGVAPGILHVHNYEAKYFYDEIIDALEPPPIGARVVNQSFVFDPSASVEQSYDDYTVRFNTIFVSGASLNAQRVRPAASSYNGIGVGVSDVANPPFGPTIDGRSKPDISAPGNVASFATPLVAGSAALLLQAAQRGDGGPNSGMATNAVLIKALLLNGAIKPTHWTNSQTSPLDHRLGAGVLNVFNSWHQLKGGRHSPIQFTSAPARPLHPPGTNTASIQSLTGWNLGSITNSNGRDAIHHYYFDVPGLDSHTFTSTLVWNRQQGQSNLNNLDLVLIDTATSNLVAQSRSAVDNVEHLFAPQLRPGRYDLQVVKRGSPSQISAVEKYALTFESFKIELKVGPMNAGNLVLSWPAAPDGFKLQSSGTIHPAATWSLVSASVVVDTNRGLNVVSLPVEGTTRFFRLQRP